MANIHAIVDAAVAGLAPIHGIRFPDEADPATWAIDFKDEATTSQRTAAQSYIDTVDLAAVQDKADALMDLGNSDMGMIRVIEDIVAALNLEDELPAASQAKLVARRNFRQRVGGN